MKILYGIQATGNGHIARATELVPYLQKYAQVDVLLSGKNASLKPSFKVKYRCKGLSFYNNKNGGIAWLKTLLHLDFKTFYTDLNILPVMDYDLVISDFEPITAWACKKIGLPCISLSHQSAVLHAASPKPAQNNGLGQWVLQHYAPCHYHIGFHFDQYSENIFYPVIRNAIRNATVTDDAFLLVYLPGYSMVNLAHLFANFPKYQWRIYTKEISAPTVQKNCTFLPVNDAAFIADLAACSGVLCGAGFETPAEAIFLNKKLLVVPLKSQYEQNCNAAALHKLGIPVVQSFNKKGLKKLAFWLISDPQFTHRYPNQRKEILALLWGFLPAINAKKQQLIEEAFHDKYIKYS